MSLVTLLAACTGGLRGSRGDYMKIETTFWPTEWKYPQTRLNEHAASSVYGRFQGSPPAASKNSNWCGEGKIVLPSQYCAMLLDTDFCKITIEFENLAEKRSRIHGAVLEASAEQLEAIETILKEERT